MPDAKDIADQQELLKYNRRTLHHYLVQKATLSGSFTPPGIAAGIFEARQQIYNIKRTLREWGGAVEDHPDDDEDSTIDDDKTVRPSISRSFLVGRWLVKQDTNRMSGERIIDYLDNGRFEGVVTQFIGFQGQRVNQAGRWWFNKLSDRSFSLLLLFDNGSQWQGKFAIIDRNRIQNMDENYIALRVN